MSSNNQVYQLALEIDNATVDAFTDTLSAISSMVVDEMPVDKGDVKRKLVIYGEGIPETWLYFVRLAAKASGTELPELVPEQVPDLDWVVESQKAHPEIRAGRFFIYGSHYEGQVPAERTHNFKLDASTAFGTGQHETTKGCLMLFDELLKSESFDNVLDLGCGTALLAMAAAASGTGAVLATDIDPEAVRVSKVNLEINQLSRRVRALVSCGFDNREIYRKGPYDLIFANILARPLVHLALPIAQHTLPGGYVILAGLLKTQEQMVLSAYRLQRLQLVKRLHLNEWSILLLHKS